MAERILEPDELAALDDLVEAGHRYLTPDQGVDDFALDTLRSVLTTVRSGGSVKGGGDGVARND